MMIPRRLFHFLKEMFIKNILSCENKNYFTVETTKKV